MAEITEHNNYKEKEVENSFGSGRKKSSSRIVYPAAATPPLSSDS